MFSVDSIACKPFWHTIHPAEKVLFAAVQMLLCSFSGSWVAGTFSLLVSCLLLATVSQDQRRQVFTLMFVPVAFLLPACIAIVLVTGNAEYYASIQFADFVFGVTETSLVRGGHLFLRAFASSAVLVFVGISTPVDHIEYFLFKIKVPSVLVELFGLIYRFIGFLSAVFVQIQNAQRARAARFGLFSAVAGAGLFASALLRKALWYQVWASYAAEARCYSGLQVFSRFPFTFSWFRFAIVCIYGAGVVLLHYTFLPKDFLH